MESKPQNKCANKVDLITPIADAEGNAVDQENKPWNKGSVFRNKKQLVGQVVANAGEQKAATYHLYGDIILLVGGVGGSA